MGHQQPVRSLSLEALLPDAYQLLNWRLSNRYILNVSTYYKQPLELLKKRGYEGRESARSSRRDVTQLLGRIERMSTRLSTKPKPKTIQFPDILNPKDQRASSIQSGVLAFDPVV